MNGEHLGILCFILKSFDDPSESFELADIFRMKNTCRRIQQLHWNEMKPESNIQTINLQ